MYEFLLEDSFGILGIVRVVIVIINYFSEEKMEEVFIVVSLIV